MYFWLYLMVFIFLIICIIKIYWKYKKNNIEKRIKNNHKHYLMCLKYIKEKYNDEPSSFKINNYCVIMCLDNKTWEENVNVYFYFDNKIEIYINKKLYEIDEFKTKESQLKKDIIILEESYKQIKNAIQKINSIKLKHKKFNNY